MSVDNSADRLGATPATHIPVPAPHTSGYVEANGLKLHYVDYGTAGRPHMLCLHGGAANTHWFDFVAGAFTADYHVHALDHRGHGESEWAQPPDYRFERYASDAEQVMEKLGIDDVVLIGHSMGGIVSLVHAATYGQRLKALIIVDSTLRARPERIAVFNEVGSREGRSYASNEEFMANFKLRPGGTQATPEVIRYIASFGARQGSDGRWRHKFDRNVYGMRELLDIPPHWARVSVPVLLVKGGLSERITPEIHADVQARCPQEVQMAEVPCSEHHVTLDNPSGFVEVVQRFLANLSVKKS